jgi:hypothetical protein
MVWSRGFGVRVICILLVYSTAKSTHLYSQAGHSSSYGSHFLIRQVYNPSGFRPAVSD